MLGLSGVATIVATLLLKLVAYSGYTYVCSHWISEKVGHSAAIKFGAIRCVVGAVIGGFFYWAIFPWIVMRGPRGTILLFPIFVIPFRWLEWAMIEPLVRHQGPQHWLKRDFLVGLFSTNSNSYSWRFFGILCSIATDIIGMILSGVAGALC
jgi:hypothetical protein